MAATIRTITPSLVGKAGHPSFREDAPHRFGLPCQTLNLHDASCCCDCAPSVRHFMDFFLWQPGMGPHPLRREMRAGCDAHGDVSFISSGHQYLQQTAQNYFEFF
jgi:hypothetical protein